MNINVIIPIVEFNETVCNYLDKAIESISKQIECEIPKVVLVYPSSIDTDIKIYMKKFFETNIKVLFVKNDGETDYQSQVNLAVDSIDSEYFSVLEFDDEYSNTYFKNINKYIQEYSDVDILMPIIIEVNDKNEGIKYTNEITWSQQFVGENGEVGFLNINSLKQYTDFKLSGAVIKKSSFIDCGKYKKNIKLTFMYELLLRMLNGGYKIFTIPKIGYKHLFNRENSMFNTYSKIMSMNERKFWFDTAMKEYNFNNDRVIDVSKILTVVKD